MEEVPMPDGKLLQELVTIKMPFGKYKGTVQEPGTFVYFITAKDIFGKSIEPKKGNITLIR